MSIALIGGTALAALPGLEIVRSHAVDTPYGAPSALIEEGKFAGATLYFLQRHGGGARTLPPHRINYRANIWALHALGARRAVAVNAVGAIDSELANGSLVVPDDLVDYTWGRAHTFDEGEGGQLQHIEFTRPYSDPLREELLAAAAALGIACQDGGVMGVTQGPRLETAAEVRRLAGDGCHLVNMTAMPEASLAREIGIDYAALCVVVNAAAGLASEPITLDAMRDTLAQASQTISALFAGALPGMSAYSGT